MSKKAEELAKAASAARASVDPKDLGTSFDDLKAEPVRWTWRPQVPRGKITILESDPGNSKSVFTLDLAARISSGTAMPDGTPVKQGTVIMMNAEDGAGDTVKPRLMAAGADCSRVIDFTTIPEGKTKRQVRLPDDVEHLRTLIKKHDAVLVVIDPLWSFVGSKHQSISDQQMREALTPLKELAEELDVAVIIIRHLNKNSKETNAVYRGAGSIGITGLARNVLTTVADTTTPRRYYLARVKANLAPASRPLCYELVSVDVKTDTGIASVPKLEWLGTINASLVELTTQEEALPPRQRQVYDLLPETGGMSTAAVADNLGTTTQNASNLLGKLVKKDRAIKNEHGLYGKVPRFGFKITPFHERCTRCTGVSGVYGVDESEPIETEDIDSKAYKQYTPTTPYTSTTPLTPLDMEETTPEHTVSTTPLVGRLADLDMDAHKAGKVAEALNEDSESQEPIDFDAPEHAWMKPTPDDDLEKLEEN